MLFATFANCSSLREIAASMLGLKGKTKHFQLKHIPFRSTLSDANKRRTHQVFEKIYYDLYHSNSKTKGGIKVHTQINLQEQVPKLVWLSLIHI